MLRLVLNLNCYDVATRRECENYDEADVIFDVPLYREQHFEWGSGRARGLCFVRKGARKSLAREFHALCSDAANELTMPYTGRASALINEAFDKLRELKEAGIATQEDEVRAYRIRRYIEAIERCRDEIDIASLACRAVTKEENDD